MDLGDRVGAHGLIRGGDDMHDTFETAIRVETALWLGVVLAVVGAMALYHRLEHPDQNVHHPTIMTNCCVG